MTDKQLVEIVVRRLDGLPRADMTETELKIANACVQAGKMVWKKTQDGEEIEMVKP